VVVQAEKTGRDGGPEREVQPAERPARHDDRDDSKDIRAKTGGNAEDGYQRGHCTGAARRGLRHASNDQARETDTDQQEGEDEMCRGGGELDERTAANRAEGQAADGRDAIDEAGAAGRVRRVQVDQRGSEG